MTLDPDILKQTQDALITRNFGPALVQANSDAMAALQGAMDDLARRALIATSIDELAIPRSKVSEAKGRLDAISTLAKQVRSL